MPQIKKNKQIDYELKLTQEEMEIIAGSLEKMFQYMKEDIKHSTLEMFVNPPATTRSKRVKIHRQDLETLKYHISHVIEES